MKRKNIIPFCVIVDDVNKRDFCAHDVMPYFIRCYETTEKDKMPKTFDEFKEFVKSNSKYMYWCRCEYELVLQPWVGHNKEKKVDVHWQLMHNLDLVTHILMLNLGFKEKNSL